MSDKIYFQWQNPILRETIYPVREMKLRHFLLYYYEIDLWQQYKHKKDWPIEKFPKERAEFLAAQKKAITEAYDTEVSLKQYFKQDVPEVAAKPGNENNADVRSLNKLLSNLRLNFRSFFKVDADDETERGEANLAGQGADRNPDGDMEQKSGKQVMGEVDLQKSRDRKEKIFVAMRVSEWEHDLKTLKRQLARKQTLINFTSPDAQNLDDLTIARDTLQDIVIPIMQKELGKLKELVAAQQKLEKRKEEFAARVAARIADRDKLLNSLLPKRKDLAKWEAKKKDAERDVARLTNQPTLNGVLDYLATSDVYNNIRNYLNAANTHPEIVEAVIGHVQAAIDDQGWKFYVDFLTQITQWVEKNLSPAAKADPSWIVQWINAQSARFLDADRKLAKIIATLESKLNVKRIEWAQKKDQEKRFVQEIADLQQVIGILEDSKLRSTLHEQWEKFEELQFALELAFNAKTPRTQRTLKDAKKDLEQAVRELEKVRKATLADEKKLDEINDALCIKREKYLKEFILENKLTLKDDILPFLADQYYAELLKLKHDQLLHEVFQRIWKEPERFPLWLQYMVIHFSGMRYASAHGSWADPRDLLLNLRTSDIQDRIETEVADIQTKGLLDASCQERLALYETLTQSVDRTAASSLPEDAKAAAQDSRFIKRFQNHYKEQLKSPIESKRSKAYIDLRVDEEGCEILAMKNEDVLDELTDLHKERHFPDWMWKEIVKLTDLRLTEVDSKEWETLTAKEQEERLYAKDKQMAQYREIMNEWKSQSLTGWRQEHERSNRLIVTRAVCNEVAEHIQHLRGHVSAAGLTQKPFWYKGAEDRYFEAKAKEKKTPRARKTKPDPRPYFVRAKDRGDDHHTFEVGASILWLRFVNDSPNEWRIAKPMATREGDELIDKKYCGRRLESGNWAYTMGEPTSRSRQKRDKKGALVGPKETQYLRWMHEATVATVADTAEGKVVLTFETALPYEDPSLSTIGVFKRYLKDLNHDQGEDAYNPAFVGFMPEKTLSTEDVKTMEEMLDWNHIFLRDVVTHAQLEEFREKYIRNHKPTPLTVQIIDPVEESRGPEPVIGLYDRKRYLEWTQQIAQPGTNMYRVRRWGDHLLKGGALSVEEVGTTNFQAIGLYNKGNKNFGAVKNFITILRKDIDHLKAMQVEDEYENKKPDWRTQKMNWLCQFEGSIYMFEKEHDSWTRSKQIRWGTLALGGNLVQVEGPFEYIDVKANGFVEPPPEEEIDPANPSVIKLGTGKFRLRMARLRGFSKWDWGRPLDDLLKEGLVHRCFCAGGVDDIKDSPQGIVYSPFYNLLHWDFCGATQPKHLYIPLAYLEKQIATPPNA